MNCTNLINDNTGESYDLVSQTNKTTTEDEISNEESNENVLEVPENTSVYRRMSSRLQELALKILRKVGLAKTYVKTVCEETWAVCPFAALPRWLQDNEYLVAYHRPPLPSVGDCLRSIFRIHSETVNIWIHLLGCILYCALAVYFLIQPRDVVPLEGKVIFTLFFASIILCLGMSFVFHTLSCYSEHVDKLFSKLDYCGIVILIMGSFISWLYYGFYSKLHYMLTYFAFVSAVGILMIIITFWDLISGPQYRNLRAILFSAFGISGAVPALHYMLERGISEAVYQPSVIWLFLSGTLYLFGGFVYALRIPERYYPGAFDVWCQSHQIFHLLVVVAPFLHFRAIYNMAFFKM